MDISAKVLRDVEFRDRLRGYDTDEVDEFLERVAIGVDELHQQVREANERADRAERQLADLPTGDDDSIRRTLVLAQRTADLAIKEAESEAERLLTEATAEAERLLNEARERAANTRSEAEEDLRVRVERLGAERGRLEQEVATLVGMVDAERGRLGESLRALLSYVAELNVVPEVREVAARPQPFAPAPAPEAEARPAGDVLFSDEGDDSLELEEDLELSFSLPDIEREVAEDADRALGQGSFGEQSIEELDPDEELWDRWARSGENALGDSEDDPLGLGRNGHNGNGGNDNNRTA